VKRAFVVLSLAATSALAGCASTPKSAADETSELMVKAANAQSADNPTLASRYYNDVIERDPRNKLAYYNLGLIAQTQEKYVEAEDNFRVALRIDPGFELARRSLAKVEALKAARPSSG
jgi:Tfp pilus assembly protein PilF